jgi:hypothetical protein
MNVEMSQKSVNAQAEMVTLLRRACYHEQTDGLSAYVDNSMAESSGLWYLLGHKAGVDEPKYLAGNKSFFS